MKLRNKKTGEIVDFVTGIYANTEDRTYEFSSIADLKEYMEDVPEEPKEYWYLENNGEVINTTYEGNSYEEKMQEIGNYFETREEAEQAVEKLKAWKRLKDKGFEIVKWTYDIGDDHHKAGQIVLNLNNVRNSEWDEYDQMMEIEKDLDLLFGGEE